VLFQDTMGLLINRVSTRSLTERITAPRCQISVCTRRQTATRTLLGITHDSEEPTERAPYDSGVGSAFPTNGLEVRSGTTP
jgi:hypothetical protein